MAFGLLRSSARRGITFRCFVSAARSGGEGLASRRPVSLPRCPPRRLSHSTTPDGHLPTRPDEKLNALIKKIRMTGAASLPSDVVVELFSCIMFARRNLYVKQLLRFWMTGFLLVSGGSVGYNIAKIQDGTERAGDGNEARDRN